MFVSFLIVLILVCCGGTGLLGSTAIGETANVDKPNTEATFFRGINLNGPAVVIDGHSWEGGQSRSYRCSDKAFENQSIPLTPITDPQRSLMIRSSRWGGNRVELTEIPKGTFTLFLYVWEDNNSERYSITVNSQRVLDGHQSGTAGHWDRLGPWSVNSNGVDPIVITSQGGAANFSGIEIWNGITDGLDRPVSSEELAFFENRVRPILVTKCYECHSAQSTELQGDLLVDSRVTLRRGGAGGAGVVPGDLEHSLVIKAVETADEDKRMPPGDRLTDIEIADLKQWVKMGAPDPRSDASKHLGKQIDIAEARNFWSLKPIVRPALPKVKDASWPVNDIDYFVLAKMEYHQLKPSAVADKRALLRRASYDLTGLPPTPEEINAFINDDSATAFARVVDRLLESPRYGERWGRHWLDVVRYADTAGDNSDYPIPQNYRYRDWVIDAFNRDQPFDEFVRDQLAGDLRGGQTERERIERIIATGYLANARRFGSRVDDYPQHLTIEDTIDNLGRAFLGVTLSCARCHDHKFDPVTNRDYYGLYGIFSSTRYPWPGIELDKRQRDFVPLVSGDQAQAIRESQDQRTQEQKRLNEVVQKLKEELKSSTEEDRKEQLKQELKDAEKAAKSHSSLPPLFETAYAVSEGEHRGDAPIQLKGNPARLGELVPRRFLSVLGGQELPNDLQGSGREQLAEWILMEDNPLTARVIVNRIWQYHFGRGLVPTPNDFGKQGKTPSHPELLDFLASELKSARWSIKALHRMIVLSASYQQSSARSDDAIASDPDNVWLSSFPRLRIDAESLRDTLLMLGGNLRLDRPGPHPFPPEDSWDFTQHKPFKAIYESNHRSVYLMTQRIQRHPYLAIFDGADPSASTAVRMSTTTPLQALFLMNDPLVHDQSALLADRLLEISDNDRNRIQSVFELLFSRGPLAQEIDDTLNFLERAREVLKKTGANEAGEQLSGDTNRQRELDRQAWRACVRSLFRLNEFIYLD